MGARRMWAIASSARRMNFPASLSTRSLAKLAPDCGFGALASSFSRRSWMFPLRGIVRLAGFATVIGEPVLSRPHLALVVPPEPVIHLVAHGPCPIRSTLRDSREDSPYALTVVVGGLICRGLQGRPHEHARDEPLVRPVVHV